MPVPARLRTQMHMLECFSEPTCKVPDDRVSYRSYHLLTAKEARAFMKRVEEKAPSSSRRC